jgi:CIC family chloride channel protein
MEALETGDGQFDYGASLVKSLASLLVVASGSAIGREGAMILLAALAASFCPALYAQIRMEVMDRLRRRRDGQRLPCSVSRKPVHCGDSVWHADAGLARPVVIAAVVALLTTQLLAPGAGTLYAVHLSGTSPRPIMLFWSRWGWWRASADRC